MPSGNKNKRAFYNDKYRVQQFRCIAERRARQADTGVSYDNEAPLINELNKKENIDIYKVELARLILGQITLDACHAFTAVDDLACAVAMLSMHKVCQTKDDAQMYMQIILEGRRSKSFPGFAKMITSLTPPQRAEILKDVVDSIKDDSITKQKVRREHIAKIKRLAINNQSENTAAPQEKN